MKKSANELLSVSLVAASLLVTPAIAATPTVHEIAKLLASDGAELDLFGRSVAVAGDLAVVGAIGDDDGRGAAYVFARSGGTWIEQQKLTPSDGTSGHLFGFDVAVEGDTAMISAPGDPGGAQSGSVYVFVRSNGAWLQQQKLTASDAAQGEQFGVSIALDGDSAVIGARASGFSGDFGSAYVFVRDGTTWTEQQKLTPSDTDSVDDFGIDVAVDSGTALIGARGDDEGRGAAYVFVWDGETWVEQQKLTAGDAAADDGFGWQVDVEGDTAIIGATGDDGVAVSLGSAYVFVRSGAIWTEQQKLTASDGTTFGLQFGNSVALAGNRVVIAAAPNHFFDRTGAVYVFARNGGTWIEELKLLASDIPATRLDGDGFGAPGGGVAISGTTVVAGAFGHDRTDPTRVDAGSAYVFSVPDNEGPLVNGLVASPNPVAVNTSITISATVDDTNTGGSEIASAAYSVDGGSAIDMTASDGDFDSPTESVGATIAGGLPVGTHEVCVSGTDADANTGPAECALLAVYDPSGGFVTGGGTILSPAGAYLADASLTGQANFGFVSSYRKGATVPDGNAQFAFQAGDLNFHSSTFEWLVIAAGKTQLKGVGAIDGQGSYGFLIFATDAEATAAAGDLDSFRIQLWDRNNGDALVYDNGAEQPLTGGSIIVHPGGKK